MLHMLWMNNYKWTAPFSRMEIQMVTSDLWGCLPHIPASNDGIVSDSHAEVYTASKLSSTAIADHSILSDNHDEIYLYFVLERISFPRQPDKQARKQANYTTNLL
jgi:hypothetical protein